MLLRLFIVSLLVFSHLLATGQALKLVVKKFERSNQVLEHYTVLKSNKAMKHGEYVSYFYRNKEQCKALKKSQGSIEHYIKQRGHYVNGKKHGAWIEYSRPDILYNQGLYQQDQKVGVWTTSRANGEVLERYDYTKHEKLVPEIRIAINYPRKVKEGDIQGTVVIQYHLQADCSISDWKVIKSLSAECDQEATRAVLKYYKYLREYGPTPGCETKTDTFKVKFQLD